MNKIFSDIQEMLEQRDVAYRSVQHAPTLTSTQSAEARGEELRTGGKALLVKLDDAFRLFVMPANRRLDSKAIKRELSTKKIRFATVDELRDQTGLLPGSVPPFGEPILPFPIYADLAIQQNKKIAFNAGSLTNSIIMNVDDYLDIAQPILLNFTCLPDDAS